MLQAGDNTLQLHFTATVRDLEKKEEEKKVRLSKRCTLQRLETWRKKKKKKKFVSLSKRCTLQRLETWRKKDSCLYGAGQGFFFDKEEERETKEKQKIFQRHKPGIQTSLPCLPSGNQKYYVSTK
jgi:hypothetical protein